MYVPEAYVLLPTADTTKQGYTTEDPSASAWSLEFEREAEKLLKFERSDSLTTLSGLACTLTSQVIEAQELIQNSVVLLSWSSRPILGWLKKTRDTALANGSAHEALWRTKCTLA